MCNHAALWEKFGLGNTKTYLGESLGNSGLDVISCGAEGFTTLSH